MSDKNREENKPKIGAGHMAAMGRIGLTEMRNAFTFSGSNITAPTDPGLYGNATQSEIREQRQEDLQPSPAEHDSVLDGRLAQAQKQAEASRDARDRDRSMEKE